MILDVLFTHGRIRTGEAARPTARTMGVFDGLVVGFDEEVAGLRAHRRFDLGGAPVIPGLHDAHHHLSGRGHALMRVDVSPAAVGTLEGLYAAVEEYAADQPEGAWVVGTGYFEQPMGGAPVRERLDAVSGGRPVWLAHGSGHGGMLSSEGIRRISGDPESLPEVPGGVVERRADGSLSGALWERATVLVDEQLRPDGWDRFVTAIGLGSFAAVASGLTSITEPGVSGSLTGNGPNDLGAYQVAREAGRLGVRATVMPELAALHELEGVEDDGPGFGLDLGLRTGFGDDRLRLGGVKIFSDGALSSRTAALREPYCGEPGNRGVLRDPVDRLHEQILAAHLAGWQVATHAIGDAAVDAVVEGYERAQAARPRPDARHRIEHAGLVDDAVLARIAAAGLVPVPQGRFISEFGASYLDSIGPERSDALYRQRSFLAAGIELPGSSDCPVTDGSPLLGIHALVNRTMADGRVHSPHERLTPAEALRAYTYGSAYAEHSEHRKGSLARGKLADFVVLTDDLLQLAPERIGQIAVQATVVGGEVAYGIETLTER